MYRKLKWEALDRSL